MDLEDDLYYYLPEELIADKPLPQRDNSRLLIIEKFNNKFYETVFSNIINFINNGDAIIFNKTKVFKARLIGITESNKKIEILLVEQKDSNLWEAMVKNSIKYKPGTKVFFNKYEAILGNKIENDFREIHFNSILSYEDINSIGLVPLPPYIIKKRKKQNLPEYFNDDDFRYQSIFGKEYGSVAAPTASFHFSEDLINKLKSKGVLIGEITLHVGPGTFRTIKKNINNFEIHKEKVSVPESTIDLIINVKKNNKRIIAVGTTVVRALETIAKDINNIEELKPFDGYTNLFIKSPYNFKIVDALITNFHMPYSTLLLLVQAFGGKNLIKDAYNYAVKNKFRFLSYGDAMFIL